MDSKHRNDPFRARYSRSLWESRRGETESATPVPDYSAQIDAWAEEWEGEVDEDTIALRREMWKNAVLRNDDEEQAEYLRQWNKAGGRGSGDPRSQNPLSAWILALVGLGLALWAGGPF